MLIFSLVYVICYVYSCKLLVVHFSETDVLQSFFDCVELEACELSRTAEGQGPLSGLIAFSPCPCSELCIMLTVNKILTYLLTYLLTHINT